MEEYNWPGLPSQQAFPVAKAGFPLICAAAFTTAVFALLGLVWPALGGLAVTLFICCFFRDPDRPVPAVSGAVVSPADGRVLFAGPSEGGDFYNGNCIKISIFMSVFDVHVNRIPSEGKVKKIAYHPGKFFSANLDKASRENEHNAVFLETEAGGAAITMVQIAGLIARRILCGVREGDAVARGQRMGMICFGSRMEVFLPPGTGLNVAVGHRVKGGTTILGYLK